MKKNLLVCVFMFFASGAFWFSLGMMYGENISTSEIMYHYKNGYEDCRGSIEVDGNYITTEFYRDFERYKESQQR